MPPRKRTAVSYAGQTAVSSSDSDSDRPAARPVKKGKGRVARSPSPVYQDEEDSDAPVKKRAAPSHASNGRHPPAVSDGSSDDDRPATVARTPLKAVSLNDRDARRLSLDGSPATKAKRRLSGGRPADLRRQSLNNSQNRAPSPLVNGRTAATPGTALGKGPPPKVAALATTAARRQARHSGAGLIGQLGGEGPSAPVSQEVMANNYEEWMKMATDNKINATNTWSFALIDYFADMSLLRNTDGDNSINFQKASCTLDGCVKIWTSRVDSVATETGKLLSGLAEDGAIMQGQEEDDEEQENGSDGEVAQRARQRKAGRKAETLVDSFDKIAAKKLDLEVSVDPLFKKTAADFDEGGAGGILMNHLGLDSTMRIIFDAGDARLDDEAIIAEDEEPDEDVDISQLRANFLPDLSVIDNMILCPSLADFKFSSDPSMVDLGMFRNNLGASTSRLEDQRPLGDADTPAVNGESNADFFASTGGHDPDEQIFDNYGGGGGGDDDFDGEGGEGGADFFAEGHEPLDPRRPPNERDLVMAFAKEGDGQMFDYFDAALAKNWAGPEHWKMSRTIRRVAADEEEKNKVKRTVKEKVPFSIDFTTPAASSSKELLEPGTKTATMLPKSKRKANDDHMLPDDMHFNSQQLLRLFLKPKAIINMRRRGLRFAPASGDGGEEVDEHYWAEANAAAGIEGDDTAALDDEAGMPMPFATQFFTDDFGPDYDDDLAMGDDVGALDGAGPSTAAPNGDSTTLPDTEAELLAAMHSQAKRVRPEHVNYAKKAKRVDVRKLKENIWRELRLEAEPPTPTPSDPATPAPAVQAKTFTTVLSGLRKAYPQDRMEEISTSFCFICLLHLANEQNLRIGNIEATNKLATLGALREGNVEEDQLFVGDLSALRITKEAPGAVMREGTPESP